MIDKLCYTSKLRNVNPNVKFFFAVVTLFICVGSRSIMTGIIALFTNGLLTVGIGKISFKHYLKIMGGTGFFLFLSTVAILFSYSNQPQSFFSISVGSEYFTIFPQSAALAIQLITTALSSISCLFFLSLSTPFTDILKVLSDLHCPALFIELMLLIYRFIFILTDVAAQMIIAQKSRLGNRYIKFHFKTVGTLLSSLFIRSLQKSDKLYTAMESRCYNGSIRVLRKRKPFKSYWILLMLAYHIFLITISIYFKLFI